MGLTVDAAANLRAGSGQVSLPALGLSLAAHRMFRPAQGSRLDLYAGPGLDLLSASSGGYLQNDSKTLAFAALVAGTRWGHRLSASWAASGAVEVGLRRGGHLFEVQNIGQVAVFPPLTLRLLAGVTWDIEGFPALP